MAQLAVARMGAVARRGAVTREVVRAYRGNSTVVRQSTVVRHLRPKAVGDAAADNAFYRCPGGSVRRLVSPGQPVLLDPRNLPDFINLLTGWSVRPQAAVSPT